MEKDIDEIIKMFRKKGKNIPEPDKKFFEDKEKLSTYVPLMTEPFRQGIIGPFHEAQLFVKPWGFKLSDISSVSLHLDFEHKKIKFCFLLLLEIFLI